MNNTTILYDWLSRQQRNYGVLALFGIVSIYMFFIVRLPGYITDDYYIFHLVSKASSSWYIDNPQEKFYLYYRPITYLYFYLLYHIVGNNPLAMKGIAVVVLLCTLLLMVGIIVQLSRYFKKDISTIGMMLSVAFVVFHPDVLQSVLWIANINELLMSMLYLLAVYTICDILLQQSSIKGVKIAIAILAFACSVLTKQQSLHLPILLIMFLVWKGKELEVEKKRALWIIAVVTLVLMFVVLLPNVKIFAERVGTENLLESLWKKPFALAGSLLYIIFPLYGLEIYSLFLVNKVYALGAAVVGFGGLVIVLKKYKIWSLHSIIVGTLLIVVIFFPRLFLATSDRINTLQVVVTAIVAVIVVGRSKKLIAIVALIVLLTMAGGMKSFFNLQQAVQFFDKTNRELLLFVQKKENTSYVMTYSEPFLPTVSSLFYLKHGKFGIDTSLQNSGVVVRNNLTGLVQPSAVYVSISFDSIHVDLKDRFSSIYLDKNLKQPKILKATSGIRGFASLTFLLNEEIARKKYTLITYSDS
ncbi:MAG: hypothetical protein AB1600_04880, partial [Bacteroidota bacterium]